MSVSSEVQIYNLALNAIGSRDNISLPTEDSREAEVCRLWYPLIRDQLLAAAAWPEATKFRAMSLLAEAEDEWATGAPRPGYTYVYTLPSDLLRPQYLTDFSHFLITGYDDNQKALHTNTESAILAYTMRLTNISLWSSELQMAVVYGLAAHICMPLSGKPSRAKMLVQDANNLLYMARESAANASTERHESVPDWIAARGYNFGASNRYVYPYGSLLSITNVN